MRRSVYAFAIVGTAVLSSFSLAQWGPYKEQGQVHHNKSSATVAAYSPRPLEQAITAVREEYGWLVNYEDPPYRSNFDLIDNPFIPPEVRRAGQRFTLVSGGAFQSTYPESSDMWSSKNAEEQTLKKIVSDYNEGRNPGKFVVRKESDGSYSIVGNYSEDDNGNEIPTPPIMDTSVSIQPGTYVADEAFKLIAARLTASSGNTVLVDGPLNALIQSRVTVGGANVPARSLMLQLVAGVKSVRLVWDLQYAADTPGYVLHLLIAQRAHYDSFGQRKTEFIR